MPLVDFRCRRCEHAFEDLVRGDEKVVCPSCGAGKPERLVSGFAARVRHGVPAASPADSGGGGGGCGSCGDPRGPGACAAG